MEIIHSHLGQILSILCAIIWAFAVILFKKSGETVHPIALNLFKNILGIILFFLTMLVVGQSLFWPASIKLYLLFVISGILGMAIADTLYFMCLNNIGAGLLAIVSSLHSPSIIILSFIFLGESLTIIQTVGVVLIVIAILLTLRIKHNTQITRQKLFWGILYGVLSVIATAIGVVIIKPHLNQVPLLWAIEIRLIAGFISLVIITLFLPMRNKIFSSLKTIHGIGYSIGGTFFGTYLSLLIWLAGMKYTSASIASALNQTSSVFVFIFAAIILKERITIQKSISLLLAIIGVFLVFLG